MVRLKDRWRNACVRLSSSRWHVALVAMLLVAMQAQAVSGEVFSEDPPQSFRVLCYHDVRDNLRESFRTWPEPTALDTRDLVRHFSWLQENGYQPVSLQQIIDARAGRARLPEKAVLLTFDDGYKSVYTKVFPLLKLFNFPAVIALVGEWIETPPDTTVAYGDRAMARSEFVTWQDVREMLASGLVEVASHSHSMHKGIRANPQGNSIVSAVSRYYWPQTGAYENDTDYAIRIKEDLKRNGDLIERELKVRPRAIAWPYGAYNIAGIRWAAEAGMPVSMSLESGPNTENDSLMRMRRTLVMFNHGLADLAGLLRQPATHGGVIEPRERVIHVDLDYVYDPAPERQEANLSKLLDRIAALRPSTVFLQAYADPDGDGTAAATYFPNRHLPMRADLFSRVAWQLRTRTGVKVYAWLPVTAFRLPAAHPAAARVVEVMPGAPPAAREGRYHRLSPFDPLVRKVVTEIYEDLGKHAAFAGILFHDDATLSDYEDASAAALRVYRDQWRLPDSVASIRSDPELRRRWTERKTAYLNEFTMALAAALREYHPALMTARNLYAESVMQPHAEAWFAQSLPSFLATYDFTAVMAMPYMEGATDASEWLSRLVEKVKAHPDGLRKTIFELQSRDWKSDSHVPSETLVAQWRNLHLAGARHWGYYPDDFHKNQPEDSVIKPAISVETNPVRR